MCIIDIIEFIQDYIDNKTSLNSGEFYYNTKEDIKNFSTLLIKNLFSHFKENVILDFTDKTKVNVRIYNKIYNCELVEVNNKYSWIVIFI
jgi:hypothetical protein